MSATLRRNEYRCPACQAAWEDTWCSGCDDTCPSCGCRDVSPHTSTPLDARCDHPDCADAAGADIAPPFAADRLHPVAAVEAELRRLGFRCRASFTDGAPRHRTVRDVWTDGAGREVSLAPRRGGRVRILPLRDAAVLTG